MEKKKIVQGSEPLLPAQQQIGGEECPLTYAQKVSLHVFIFLVRSFVMIVGMWAVGKILGKLSCRIDRCVAELREDESDSFYYVTFFVVAFVLGLLLFSVVFVLDDLLKAAIWG